MRANCSGRPIRSLVAALVAVAAVMAFATEASAAWRLVYAEDWSTGTGGWSPWQSRLPHLRPARRIHVGHPLGQYVILFTGSCGWGARANSLPPVPVKIVTRVYTERSVRNAISVNVRNRSGGLIYKYSLGSNNMVSANCQGAADQPVNLGDLTYKRRHPYDIMSMYPGGNGYYLGLRDAVTGEERWSRRFNNTKGGGAPAWLDIDQEGGAATAYLGRVEVWLDDGR